MKKKKKTGCSKCRWSKNGCGKCRPLKTGAALLRNAEALGPDSI